MGSGHTHVPQLYRRWTLGAYASIGVKAVLASSSRRVKLKQCSESLAPPATRSRLNLPMSQDNLNAIIKTAHVAFYVIKHVFSFSGGTHSGLC